MVHSCHKYHAVTFIRLCQRDNGAKIPLKWFNIMQSSTKPQFTVLDYSIELKTLCDTMRKTLTQESFTVYVSKLTNLSHLSRCYTLIQINCLCFLLDLSEKNTFNGKPKINLFSCDFAPRFDMNCVGSAKIHLSRINLCSLFEAAWSDTKKHKDTLR